MGEEVKISNTNNFNENYSFYSIYNEQIFELAEIRNPSLREDELNENIINDLKLKFPAVYVYYTWRNLVLETVPEEVFIEIKTNRNKLLITAEEQQKLYYDSSISIAGMSVGSSLLYGLVGTGIGKNIIISDFDHFSTSNLNRVQANILDVGQNKAVVAKRKALEMNPFLNIQTITTALTSDNLSDFITANTSIVFEEIDDFKMKLELRKYSKTNKKAFVMMTNLGDAVLIDVERHDTESAEVFNGNVSPETISKIEQATEIDSNLMKELSVSLVDRELIPKRAIDTLQEIGKTLVGRPQLYSTVALDGGIAPYVARKVLLGGNLVSGRYSVNLMETFKL